MAEKAYPNAPPYPMDGQPAQYSAGFVPEQPPPPYNATGGHIGFQPPPSQHQHAPTVQPIMQNRVVTRKCSWHYIVCIMDVPCPWTKLGNDGDDDDARLMMSCESFVRVSMLFNSFCRSGVQMSIQWRQRLDRTRRRCSAHRADSTSPPDWITKAPQRRTLWPVCSAALCTYIQYICTKEWYILSQRNTMSNIFPYIFSLYPVAGHVLGCRTWWIRARMRITSVPIVAHLLARTSRKIDKRHNYSKLLLLLPEQGEGVALFHTQLFQIMFYVWYSLLVIYVYCLLCFTGDLKEIHIL